MKSILRPQMELVFKEICSAKYHQVLPHYFPSKHFNYEQAIIPLQHGKKGKLKHPKL